MEETKLQLLQQKYEEEKHKRRWAFLIALCLIEFGRYYCVDLVSSLQNDIMDLYDIGGVGYNSLYSVYAFPNLIIPFIMGYLVDRIGRQFGVIFCCSFVLLGQALLALSSHHNITMFWLAVFGRFLFGCFGKSQNAIQATYVSDWFKSSELALGLAMTVSIARAGTALNYFIAPPIYTYSRSIACAFWVGTALLFLSLVCTMVTVLIDQSAEHASGYNARQKKKSGVISFKDLKKFSKSFWLVVISLVGYYIGFLCFVNISAGFARDRFNFSREWAGRLASILHLISAIVGPFIGIFVDKIGRRTLIASVSCGILCATHLYYAFLPNRSDSTAAAIIGYVLIGLSYCFFNSASWPMIPYTVDDKVVGTGFGIAFCCENMGLVFVPLILGAIMETDRDVDRPNYFWVNFVLALGTGLGLLASIFLYIVDRRSGGVLWAKDAAQQQKIQREAAKQHEQEEQNTLQEQADQFWVTISALL